MATSGSTNFTQTRNEIIADALTTLGVYRPGATVATVDYNFCSNWLNKIVKEWEAQGIHIWAEKEGTLFLREDVNTYTLSSSSTDNAGDDTVETTLSAAASSSATTLTLTATTGMTAADVIGIELDDGTRQWTTIVSVDSSTALTITTGLTSAASSGNTVFTYTTHASKPLHISSARFRNSDGNDRIITIKGRDDFMAISTKTTSGKINTLMYAPGLTSTTVYVWPTPDSTADRLKYSYVRMLEDFDASSDNPDFPTEWLSALTLTLMWRVSRTYGKDRQAIQELKADAIEALIEMQLWDSGSGSTTVAPAYRDDE